MLIVGSWPVALRGLGAARCVTLLPIMEVHPQVSRNSKHKASLHHNKPCCAMWIHLQKTVTEWSMSICIYLSSNTVQLWMTFFGLSLLMSLSRFHFFLRFIVLFLFCLWLPCQGLSPKNNKLLNWVGGAWKVTMKSIKNIKKHGRFQGWRI